MLVKDQERIDRMIAMRAEGKTLDEIGKEYGLSRERVRQIIGNTGRDNPAKRALAKKIGSMRAEGLLLKEIADQTGLSVRQVQCIAVSENGGDWGRVKRFWSKYTVTESGCWEWTGTKIPAGYGRASFEGKNIYAHRLAWILTYGEIPEGMMACHHCDNPGCINPDHLFLGDASDNARDREDKQRNIKTVVNMGGHSSKLTDNDVLAARKLYGRGLGTMADLSRCFRVTYGNMHAIVTGKTWKHLLPQVGA